MSGDMMNGCFEAFGAVLTWRNALQLYRDRKISGVYWPATAFFAAWGLFNLWYYPSLDQWWSFAGGVVLVVGNIAWVVMALLWRRNGSR
jgi:hypothetical protein